MAHPEQWGIGHRGEKGIEKLDSELAKKRHGIWDEYWRQSRATKDKLVSMVGYSPEMDDEEGKLELGLYL